MPDQNAIPAAERALYNVLLLTEHVLGVERTREVLGPLDDRLQARIARKLERRRRRPGRVDPIPRVSQISSQSFRRHWFHGMTPLVIEGAARSWPAVQRWSFDYLAEAHGDAPVVWQLSEGVNGRGVPAQRIEYVLADLIADMRRGERRYLQFNALLDQRPALRQDFDLAYLDSLAGRSFLGNAFKFFMGADGTVTNLHNAATGNIFVFAEGVKRWRLYPAGHTAALRMPAARGNYNYCYVDPYAADHDEFPAFPFLDGWEGRIEAGDLLFVPPFVWHHVQNEGETIGMSYRYADVPGALRASLTMTVLRLLSQDEPFWRVASAVGRPERAYQHGFQAPGDQSRGARRPR